MDIYVKTFTDKCDEITNGLSLDTRCEVTEKVIMNLGENFTDDAYLVELVRQVSFVK